MLEKIKALVAENLGVEESKITENSSFKEDLERTHLTFLRWSWDWKRNLKLKSRQKIWNRS